MMNPDLKARWVAALRSGDFIQGKYEMCVSPWDEDPVGDKAKHCCLGVLRNIVQGNDDVPEALGDDDDDAYNFPTQAELDEWGLDRQTATLLAAYNDGDATTVTKHKTFRGIATYIENRKTL